MTVDQVITLLQNGYTKEEITQMEQSPVESHPAQEPQQNPEQPAQEQPAQEPQPDPKPEQPAQPAQPNDIDSRLTGIEKNIASLIRSIQQSNLKSDSFGSTPESLEDQTDRIMASLIRPEPAKKE